MMINQLHAALIAGKVLAATRPHKLSRNNFLSRASVTWDAINGHETWQERAQALNGPGGVWYTDQTTEALAALLETAYNQTVTEIDPALLAVEADPGPSHSPVTSEDAEEEEEEEDEEEVEEEVEEEDEVFE